MRVIKLDSWKEDELHSFFCTYGLLGATDRHEITISQATINESKYGVQVMFGDRDIHLWYEVERLKEAVNLWIALKNNEIANLTKIDSSLTFRMGYGKEILDERKSKNPMGLAMEYLNYLINQNLGGVNEATQIIDGEFVPAITFTTPLDFAWWQFKEDILDKVDYRTCENPKCRTKFAVRHASQKFCPPPLGKKRSTCENTHNQRLRRIAKRKQKEN